MSSLLVVLQKSPDSNKVRATFFLGKKKNNFHCLPSKAAESAGNPVIATVATVCGLGHVTNVLKEI